MKPDLVLAPTAFSIGSTNLCTRHHPSGTMVPQPCHPSCLTGDFKRPISCWFRSDRKRMYQEKNEAVTIAPKHNNSFETFPYAIRNHLAVEQSDFTLQISS